MQELYSRFWAIEVEYELRRLYGPSIPVIRRRFARKGERIMHFEDYPYSKSAAPAYGRAYDGQVWQQYLGNIRWGYVWVKLPSPQLRDIHDWYMSALGVPVTASERADAAWHPNFLPYCLDAPGSRWELAGVLYDVNGYLCHLLRSSSGQMIAVDCDAGFAMRFREMRQVLKDAHDAKDPAPLLGRWYFSKLTEVAPGVYLPRRVDVVSYMPAQSPRTLWNRPRVHDRYAVTKVVVGEAVPDDVFTIDFPPGTVVEDERLNQRYRIGPNGEKLDVFAGLGRRAISGSRRAAWAWTLWITSVVVVAVTARCVWRLLSRAKKQRIVSSEKP